MTLLMHMVNVSIIKDVLNYLTLGSYGDLSKLLTPSYNPEVGMVAWVMAVAKWALLVATLFVVFKSIFDRVLRDKNLIFPAVATAAVLLCILLVYNTPWHDATVIGHRVSSFLDSFTWEKVDYKPFIYPIIGLVDKPVSMLNNSVHKLYSFFPSTVSLPSVNGKSIGFHKYSISWVGMVIVLAIVLGASYFLARFSKYLSAALIGVFSLVAFGIDTKVVSSVVLIIAMAYLAVWLYKNFKFLVPYPVAMCVILTAYIVQPPKAVLMGMLMVAFVLCLYPLFYMFGILLYGISELVEGREKIGMKIKPKKVVEEYASYYDPRVVGLVLTALFVVVVILFDVSVPGIGVFVTTSVALLKW